MAEIFTKVVLDRPWRIRFSNRALYRIQTLDRPLDLTDVFKPKRTMAALSQWLWACMDEENPFDTPEKVADVIDVRRINEIVEALVQCVNLGQPKKDAKNVVSSTPSPSPASSSD